MSKTVKVRIMGTDTVREVSFEEAEEILEKTYNDPVGGLVVDAGTGEVIWRLGTETDEIIVVEQMIGGG